jgi:hypothetical protein
MTYNAPDTVYYKEASRLKKEGRALLKAFEVKIEPSRLKNEPRVEEPQPSEGNRTEQSPMGFLPPNQPMPYRMPTMGSQFRTETPKRDSWGYSQSSTSISTLPASATYSMYIPKSTKRSNDDSFEEQPTYPSFLSNFIHYRSLPHALRPASKQTTHPGYSKAQSVNWEELVENTDSETLKIVNNFAKLLFGPKPQYPVAEASALIPTDLLEQIDSVDSLPIEEIDIAFLDDLESLQPGDRY